MTETINFFEQKRETQKRSYALLTLLTLVIATLAFSPYIITFLAILTGDGKYQLGLTWTIYKETISDHSIYLFLITTSGFLSATILWGFLVRYLSLNNSQGLDVMENLQGRPIYGNTNDIKEKMLINIVEEIAIASGVNAPLLYVFDNEPSINAITTGTNLNNIAIGVTKGALTHLNREELQGIIAHEFSHMFYGDTEQNLNLLCWSYGLISIYNVGRYLIQIALLDKHRSYKYRKDKDKGKGGGVVIGVLLCIAGLTSYICSKIIKSAFIRQREYLADAMAVQYTRNPMGIGKSLIKAYQHGSLLNYTPSAAEASHMFFAKGVSSFDFFGVFATHPPIHKRLAVISPKLYKELGKEKIDLTKKEDISLLTQTISTKSMAMPFSEDKIKISSSILNTIPPILKEYSYNIGSIPAIIYALLLDKDNQKTKDKQLSFLQKHISSHLMEECLSAYKAIIQLKETRLLPLFEMLYPTYRTLLPQEQKKIVEISKHLIKADNQCNLFEYALLTMLQAPLGEKGLNSSPAGVKNNYNSLASILLCAVANFGANSKQEAKDAFLAGAQEISLQLNNNSYKDNITLEQFDYALRQLSNKSHSIKRKIYQGCLKIATADGKINIKEAEALRAIATMFNITVPIIKD